MNCIHTGAMTRLRRGSLIALAAGACLVAAPQQAFSDEGDAPRSYPYIEGELSFEIQSDHTVDSDDPGAELSDTYNTTELAIAWHFSRMFSIHGSFTFEPVLDPTDDRVFDDHGLYAEELYAQFNFDPVRVFAGKFNPAFGKAWDAAPGVYGTDFAEDYELTERIGFGAEVTQKDTALGTLAVTASVFYADITSLSNSAFTNRGKTSLTDGGPSNTGALDSFAVALDGSDLPGLPGLSFHLGYRHQAAGEGDPEDQNGYVAALLGSHTMNDVGFEWVAEVAYLDSAADLFDDPVDEVWYYTLGGKVTVGRYNVAITYTGRPSELMGGEEFDDQLLQVSAGVELQDGWSLDVGYKYHVEEEVDNHTVGVLLAKSIEFSTAE